MDMRVLSVPGFPYAPPRCFELPVSLTVEFAGGDRDYIAFPSVQGDGFFCAKITDTIYYVSRAEGSDTRRDYAIDMSSGSAARVSGGTDSAKLDFGAVGGAAAPGQCAPSGDLDGNAIRWTFGTGDDSWLTAQYSNGGVRVRRPDGSEKSAKSFAAARVAEGVYIYYETFEGYRVTMLCDFGKALAVGT
ncbi:MAG: hypothetical protein LBC21_02475, partial [Oscillospiraceae bacterium]|nr:hypothetical protein [Oscillospiraceae bacterium]